MREQTNFILAVVGFILLCLCIAKFVITPLFKKFPELDTLARIGGAVGAVLLIVSMIR